MKPRQHPRPRPNPRRVEAWRPLIVPTPVPAPPLDAGTSVALLTAPARDATQARIAAEVIDTVNEIVAEQQVDAEVAPWEADDRPHCGHLWVDDTAGYGLPWVCTLSPGHGGEHEAYGGEGRDIPFATAPEGGEVLREDAGEVAPPAGEVPREVAQPPVSEAEAVTLPSGPAPAPPDPGEALEDTQPMPSPRPRTPRSRARTRGGTKTTPARKGA